MTGWGIKGALSIISTPLILSSYNFSLKNEYIPDENCLLTNYHIGEDIVKLTTVSKTKHCVCYLTLRLKTRQKKEFRYFVFLDLLQQLDWLAAFLDWVLLGGVCTELEKAGGEEAREIMLICHIHSHCPFIGNSQTNSLAKSHVFLPNFKSLFLATVWAEAGKFATLDHWLSNIS